ncbi:MAG: ABC transporter permease [Muribaculaceae bacterium]|nr:ABC transporter permease [Muribaculaceae bacterium]
MFDLIHEIAQTLRNNRLRTMLTGLAVAWGIFMLILLLGAARGVLNSFNDNVDHVNTIRFYGGRTSIPYRGYKDGRYIELRGSDMEAMMRETPGVKSVIAYASVDTAKIFTERDYTGGFNAVYPEVAEFNKIKMKYGRFVNNRDISEGRRVVVLHEKNARILFGDDSSAVGKVVRSLNLAWTVVGVYTHEWLDASYVPFSTYKALTGNRDYAYMLEATVDGMKTIDDGNAVENSLRGSLAKIHTFSPNDNSAVWTWNRFTSYLTNAAALGYLDMAVWIIGLFTLLSGIVGVSNIMFVSVRERTHEIGIRRAIGAKPRAILAQIISEGVAITAIFGYIGVFLGMAILQVINAVQGNSDGFKNPTVDINIAIKVTIVLIIAGAIAGLFPALKAIKVKPVEALRDE